MTAPQHSHAPVITVDGPSGTGKGTLAGRIANRLGWHLLDSGALYRVVAYSAKQHAVEITDIDGLRCLALALPVTFSEAGGEVHVLFEGRDVTSEIRSEDAGRAASEVAAVPAVREALLARQREFQQPPGLVADGRDMGTVVFPQADLKIYLTASPEIRAERRYKQLKQKGISVNLARLLEDICDRDRRDEQRAVSPLRPASDAIILDTTALDINAVDDHITALISQRGIA